MNWSEFKPHGEAPSRAFEGFCGVLFERFCRREYRSRIENIIYVNGAGGDGGVEAYAKLRDGRLIGLQTKWFLTSIDDAQVAQIEKSVVTAAAVRKGLARYFVCVPRDLCDPKTNKATKRQSRTERDRWNQLVATLKVDFPELLVELWDDTKLGELLATLGSEGLQRYWFDRTVIDINDLQRVFQQARCGWLSRRYSPDLHQVGLIEKDLRIRLEGPSAVPVWHNELQRLSYAVDRTLKGMKRLRRFPDLLRKADAERVIASAEAWLLQADEFAQELKSITSSNCKFPVSLQGACSPPWTGLGELLDLLEQFEKPGLRVNPFKPYINDIKQLGDEWEAVSITPEVISNLSKPVAYVGEPGAGKTDALANAVEVRLESGLPAVLIRAKEYSPQDKWSEIICKAVGEPSWTLPQIFDALEATAALSDVRRTSAGADSNTGTSRVLIAIDGLDESTRAERWADRLNELETVVRDWPRILIACSYRSSLARRFSRSISLSVEDIRESDVPVDVLLKKYCEPANISYPPLLRWALQSPLSIRLLSELFAGNKISKVSLSDFSIQQLVRKKIEHVEASIRDADSVGWESTLIPVRQTLRAVVTECFTKGRAVTTDEALDVIEGTITPKSIFTRQRLLGLLHECSNSGLLLHSMVPAEDPLDDDTSLWEPAYDFLTDYFLATEAMKTMAPDSKVVPKYLRHRPNARALTVSLLGAEGHHFLVSRLWEKDLTLEEREELQLIVISTMPVTLSAYYGEWVTELIKRSMPSCRQVLTHLIVPGLRIPGFFFGGSFLHNVLLPMSVSDRDLFWSGPNYVPTNNGAIWEGYGDDVIERLTISSDDTWNTAPLLLAWGSTTVNNKNRRRIRAEIAKWGAENPEGGLQLLKIGLQTNDPQMKEDLLTALYGSTCLCRPDDSWSPIAEWITDNYLSKAGVYTTDNIVERHAVVGIVERLQKFGVTITARKLNYVRFPKIVNRRLLPIDVGAITHANDYLGKEPITGDFEWYVLPHAFEPFFVEGSNIPSQDEENKFKWVPEDILRKFVERKIRAGAANRSHAGVRSELRRRQKANTKSTDSSILQSLSCEALESLLVAVSEHDQKSMTEKKVHKKRQPQYCTAATSILRAYAKVAGVKLLTPLELATGVVRAYISNLGWSKDKFYGCPNGGKSGEVLGADIAILRNYPQATHGAKSSVATFAEKYIWCAVHEFMGYLADRLPASKWGPSFPAPVNPALVSEVVNPAMDVSREKAQACDGIYLAELLPKITLESHDQVDRANEWVLNAPLPQLEKLLVPLQQYLPEWARQEEWLILNAFVVVREEDSQSETAFWASSATFDCDFTTLVKEDAKQQLLPYFGEYAAGVERVGTYVDPHEAVWAPWIAETEASTNHTTLDDAGTPVSIDFTYGSCKMYWESKEGEEERYMPALWLRSAQKITDLNSGRFIDATGETMAFLAEAATDLDIKFSRLLFVRRDSMERVLREQSRTLCWSARVYREPSTYLIQNGWARKQMDFRAFVTLDNGKMTTFQQSKIAGDW
jgi:hypothetical protein